MSNYYSKNPCASILEETPGPNRLVRFYLPQRYWQTGNVSSNGMHRSELIDVLLESIFPENSISDRDLLHRSRAALLERLRTSMDLAHRYGPQGSRGVGFYVVCSEAAFGRFIVNRCKSSCPVNGVRDLRPEMGFKFYSPALEAQSAKLGLTPPKVVEVLRAFGFNTCTTEPIPQHRAAPDGEMSIVLDLTLETTTNG